MGKIAVLDDNMVNMIAAGEVIERPASVVKELLENSIDAGATRLTLAVEDGGRKRICVTDDGGGMDAADIELAFEPHATSKIRTSNDLASISTMGFRGEALASIASVAAVSLVSRTPESIQANVLSIDCGQKEPMRPASGDVGTTIDVRNLFYKLPARRKFLRTANTEMTHITEHFTRIALAHLSLDMRLIHNSRQVYHLPSGQSLAERIGVLFGGDTAGDLLAVSSDEKGMRIGGLIGKPSAARSSANYQYVFLNRRFIRDKFIGHALRQAYQGLMEPGRYPVVFLFIDMPPELFDVNVHPTKTEVRFDNPNLVHSQVLGALREKLLSVNLNVGGAMPTSFTMPAAAEESLPDSELNRRQLVLDAVGDFFKKPQGGSQRKFTFRTPDGPFDRGVLWQGKPLPQPAADNPQSAPFFPSANTYLQIHSSYILAACPEGFEVIDQHALHERILYGKLCEKVNQGKLAFQRLLTPVLIQATPAQMEAFEKHSEIFDRLGIELSAMGPQTLGVQSFPMLLEKADPQAFVADVLDALAGQTKIEPGQDILKSILERAACAAAVKAGQPLSGAEIAQLLADKARYPEVCRCPHGRPTTITFSLKDLEKQFKRTGF